MDEKTQEYIQTLIVEVFKLLKADCSEADIKAQLLENEVPEQWADFIIEQAYKLGQHGGPEQG